MSSRPLALGVAQGDASRDLGYSWLTRFRGASRYRASRAWLLLTLIRAAKSSRRAQAFPAVVARLMRLSTQSAHLLVGIPDYQRYVKHRQTFHRGEPVMSYRDFFRDREEARYAVEKGGGFGGIG